MTKRTLSDAFPSKYLNAADLENKQFTATIDHIDYEKMRDGAEKPVVYFAKITRGVVLNKTKAKFLSELSKSLSFDDWVGLDVHVSAGVTNFGGEETACIKFARSAKAKQAQIKDELDDEIPDFA